MIITKILGEKSENASEKQGGFHKLLTCVSHPLVTKSQNTNGGIYLRPSCWVDLHCNSAISLLMLMPEARPSELCKFDGAVSSDE